MVLPKQTIGQLDYLLINSETLLLIISPKTIVCPFHNRNLSTAAIREIHRKQVFSIFKRDAEIIGYKNLKRALKSLLNCQD